MTPRTSAAALGALLLAVTLTACGGTPDGGSSPTPDAPTPTSSASAEPAATPTPTADAAEPACDTIISPGTVDALSQQGWTFEEKEFLIGDVSLPDGLLCFWADYSVPSDHGQLYGWSTISPDDASRAQTALLSEGWTREDGTDGIYFTEDPQRAMGTDEDGYGMTYLFGDGWVKFADTRQGLILIDWAG
ncbi:hypothetical protein [Microbacterium sp. 1.5R]|uniref:hypothetical protein n=1 Tax=Microbacterium sp. 1.5R TaxID=1916917 RepID=UPI0011AAFE89|nr:hypothetical protein [Microbacterium sp. 1.5R]